MRAFLFFGGKKHMGLKPIYTHKPMRKTFLFYASTRDIELLRIAASQQEVSRSAFIRQAIRERASRVLAGLDDYLSSEVGTVLGLRGAKKSESKE
jgi:hypothetical protein